MKIAYKLADRQGVGSYRILFPMRELVRQFGWQCEPFSERVKELSDGRTARFFDDSELPLDADLIILQREMNLMTLERIETWQQEGRKVIMDLDDDHSRLSPSNAAWASSHPDPRVRAKHLGRPLTQRLVELTAGVNRNNIWDIAGAVDAITVSTDALAETYGKRNPNVVRLSNALDWEMWEDLEPPKNERLRIGYMGLVSNHLDDLNELRGVIGPFLRSHPEIDFVAAGDAQVHEILEVPEGQRISFERQPFGEHVEMTAAMDIALVPLAPTGFNDAKCLDTETRVSTPRGFSKIGDLRLGDRIWNGERFAPVTGVSLEDKVQGLRISTRLGRELRLTTNHRLLDAEGKWVHARDLSIGDCLPISSWRFAQTKVQIAFPLLQTRQSSLAREFDVSGSESLPRIEIDESWAEFLGFFVGDGSCTKNAVTISCDGIDSDVIERVKDLFREIGLPSSSRQAHTFDGTLIRKQWVRASSRHLLDLLEFVGVAGRVADRGTARPRLPCVPEVIWRSPRSVVRAFLRGYFEADASVFGTSVHATSKDERLLRGVQELLLGFGVTSLLRKLPGPKKAGYADREYWHLSLRRAEIDEFAQKIGFVSERKSRTLRTISSRAHSNAYRPMPWIDEVEEIVATELRPVDIEVEGERFIASGWVSHNSALKGMEANAAWVPFVASPAAAYREYVDNGGGGLLAKRGHHWTKQLERLVSDESLRQTLGRRGREFASLMTIQRCALYWRQAYERIVPGEGAGAADANASPGSSGRDPDVLSRSL